MGTKYEICPVCGKKGLRHEHTNLSVLATCRYCGSWWAISAWTVKTQRGVEKCPKCGIEGMKINGEWAVYPHYEPIDPAIIQKRIDAAKRACKTKQ
jgi:ribosomal protein L37AE/L43A